MKRILLSLLILAASALADTAGTNYKLRSNLKNTLNISGTRVMQESLDMAGFDILNVGDFDAGAITTDSIAVSDLTDTRIVFAGVAGLLSDDDDLKFILDTLYATNLTSTGTITGGTFTDGTASLTGGNLTGMGNITGTDVDISAGTGDYTSSGSITATGGTITGITLDGSPVISGPFSWTGVSKWTISDASKTIEIGLDGLQFIDNVGVLLFLLDPDGNTIQFGNATDNPEFIFNGTGLTTLGGKLIVDGGDIGITADSTLIQLSTGQVDINGGLNASYIGPHTIARTLTTTGAPGRVLLFDREISPAALAGDGTEVRFRLIDDSFTEVVGALSFSTISNLDATPESIFKVSTVNAGTPTVGLTLDNLGNLDVIGDASIGGDLTVEDRVAINTSLSGLYQFNIIGDTGAGETVGLGVNIETGTGGAGTGTLFSTGGDGGIVRFRPGVGGGASTATIISNDAGDGGQFDFTSGNGGVASGNSAANVGGKGGMLNIFGGFGGNATGTGTVNVAGAGGTIEARSGPGADATNGSSNTGGDGGDVILSTNTGGTGATANGNSGEILFQIGLVEQAKLDNAGNAIFYNNVRIGDTTAPTNELEVAGRLVLEPTELTITAAGGITTTRSEHGIVGDGGAIDITANPQIAAGTAGQLLILEGRSDTNTVQLDNGNGMHIHGRAIMGNHDVITLRYDGVNSEWTEVSRNFSASEKAWSFASPVGSSGTFYTGGYYLFGASNFTPAGGQTLGTANKSYAAHAFVVLGANSTDMVVRVSGTSIDDNGTRTAADTEDIDTSGGSTDDYFETPKKWIGQVNYTLQSGTGVTVNYGFSKYWDNNNNDFRIIGIEVTGRAGANDANPNISLIHHKATGWTYNAGSTPSPPAPVVDMNTDHNTEIQYATGENFAWKRSNLTSIVLGGDGEGTIIQWDTSSGKSVDIAHVLLRIRAN